MIIDAHNHPDWHGHDLNKFLENMKANNIDKTWLLTWECPDNEFSPTYYKFNTPLTAYTGPIAFSSAVHYVEQAPDKFILGYAPDPRKPEAIDLLSAAIEIHGVRVYGELKVRMMFDNLDAMRVYRFCGTKKLPITVHVEYEHSDKYGYPRAHYWYGGGILPFERAVAGCPDTNFLGHGPGFWAHISEGYDPYIDGSYPKGDVKPGGKVVEMLRRYPNLYGDLSAGSGLNSIKRDPAFGKDFILEFQDRLLYARDYFDNAHQEFLNSLDLPKDVLDKLYSGNALKLVPLK